MNLVCENILIKENAKLLEFIKNKKVLHLNSFGKDSIACLNWLAFSGAEVVSINFSFIVNHPADEIYLKYLKNKFTKINFVTCPSPMDLNKFIGKIYQSPIDIINEFNDWEYTSFDSKKLIEEMREKYHCDLVCLGHSKYESVTRATNFYKNGLLQGNRIYPLGLLNKKQVLQLATKIKLHPCYKTGQHTQDYPSYYKMRSDFIKYPEYKQKMYEYFPLLILDEYRYEVMLENRLENKKTKKKQRRSIFSKT